ncbi:hypothetical protein RhiirB3_479132 [Rhizophagus irregularis]|nr:hypothetical protein RhiirB3_479132 [Rhizophagus irregularis]
MAYYFYSLYLYLILILVVFFGVESYAPIGRLTHSSVLIKNNLYFFGGQYRNENPPWFDLTSTASIPFGSHFATVASNDVNNNLDIYLFGGVMVDIITQQDSFTSFVFKFNVNSSRWNAPSVNGIVPKRRRKINAVSDNSGKIYIYGGVADGHENLDQIVDISKIVLYDIKSSTWSIKTAKFPDQIIDNRLSHTAVLDYCFGGSKIANGIFNVRVSPDLAVLNTETEPFEWTIPKVTSSIGIFPSLKGHTANLVGNYMIVAFGNITQLNTEPSETNTNIYLMDIRNFTWVNSFEFEIEQHAEKKENSQSNESNDKKVVVAAVFGVIVTIIVMIGAFLIYKWVHKKRKNLPNPPNPGDHLGAE